MVDQISPRDGGCRCGQVRFTVTAPPMLTMACHCTGCQRMTASAFSLSAAIPNGGFTVTKGEPVLGGLHGELQHFFCPHCKSWLFTRFPTIAPFVNIRSTMLDDSSWTTPFVETYTSEKLTWATTPAMHSFPKFPAFENFEALTRDYAEWSAGPTP
jgi:hypothetical protein